MESNIVKVNDIYVKKEMPVRSRIEEENMRMNIMEKKIDNDKIIEKRKNNSQNKIMVKKIHHYLSKHQKDMPIEEFLIKFCDLPEKFIQDFKIIIDEDHNENIYLVDFNKILFWLNIRKDNLKRLLIANFEKELDYTVKNEKIKCLTGTITKEKILITTICFKELCMLSKSEDAKKVREFFVLIDALIRNYDIIIKNRLNEKLKLYDNFFIKNVKN